MKKIISLVAALSMAATAFVSFATVASAATQETSVSVTVLDNTGYKAITGKDIPTGNAAYTVEVDISAIDTDGYGTGLYYDGEFHSCIIGASLTAQNLASKVATVTETMDRPPFSEITNSLLGATSDSVLGSTGIFNDDVNMIFAASTGADTRYPSTSAIIEYSKAIKSVDNLLKYYVVLNTTDAVNVNYTGLVEYQLYSDGSTPVGDSAQVDFNGTLNFPGVATSVPATSISIIGPSVYVANVGGTGALGTSVEPSNTTDTVVWSSSDDTVVEITEGGTWTAKKPGKATLTATAGTKTASVVVKVKPKFTCGTKWTSGNDIVWGNSKIEAPVFGTNFKGVLSDGTDSKEVALSGDLEATGDITFDVVVKVINATAGELTFDVTCDAAE